MKVLQNKYNYNIIMNNYYVVIGESNGKVS